MREHSHVHLQRGRRGWHRARFHPRLRCIANYVLDWAVESRKTGERERRRSRRAEGAEGGVVAAEGVRIGGDCGEQVRELGHRRRRLRLRLAGAARLRLCRVSRGLVRRRRRGGRGSGCSSGGDGGSLGAGALAAAALEEHVRGMRWVHAELEPDRAPEERLCRELRRSQPASIYYTSAPSAVAPPPPPPSPPAISPSSAPSSPSPSPPSPSSTTVRKRPDALSR
mmetsp:Transcript_9879/g.32360  ORF Transcript_9879/g.32360 Transcript_9879/m.32360 type:complete len:225 (+) Transcript_9879:126-800(+)